MTRNLVTLTMVLGLIAAGCGDDSSGSSGSNDASDGATAGVIRLESSDLGDILVDDGGNTLYLFAPDAQGESTCYEECEANWPILAGEPAVDDGLDDGLLGFVERTNGDTQATYNGWPLYYFANDAAPGDTNGQGVGDVWYVVDAAGNGIGLAG